MKRKHFLYAIILILVIVAFGVFVIPRKATSPLKTFSMNISSPEFKNNGPIPAKFTCQGKNINPELIIEGVPAEAKSLALIMDDPDIPDFVKKARGIEVFDHWVAFNIPSRTLRINEGIEPEGVAGANSSGKTGYTGPCPPDREHRYFFKLYALDSILGLKAGASKSELESEIAKHELERAELMGTYKKS